MLRLATRHRTPPAVVGRGMLSRPPPPAGRPPITRAPVRTPPNRPRSPPCPSAPHSEPRRARPDARPPAARGVLDRPRRRDPAPGPRRRGIRPAVDRRRGRRIRPGLRQLPALVGPLRPGGREIIELPGGARVESPTRTPAGTSGRPGQTAWRDRFVAVQSVHIDRQNRLWVLDTGRVSRAAGRQACVYEIDLAHDQVRRSSRCPFEVAPEGSYLNDIRLTPDGRHAFISESGLGAIIVLDVEAGTSAGRSPTTPAPRARAAKTPVVGGRPWLPPRIGRAARRPLRRDRRQPDGEWVYYQAISENTLYRVPADALIRPGLDHRRAVERVGDRPGHRRHDLRRRGQPLLLRARGERDHLPHARRRVPSRSCEDPAINWPDSFAIDRPTGTLYFTTARSTSRPTSRPTGPGPTDPFRVWSTRCPE
jgi:hypothetical protein